MRRPALPTMSVRVQRMDTYGRFVDIVDGANGEGGYAVDRERARRSCDGGAQTDVRAVPGGQRGYRTRAASASTALGRKAGRAKAGDGSDPEKQGYGQRVHDASSGERFRSVL
jgi:hypothetical protein